MEERELRFKLSKELEYSTKGETEKTLEITIGAPCVAVLKSCTRFEQSITRAVFEARKLMGSEEAPKELEGVDPDDALDARAVKVMLLASTEDLSLTYEAFKTLALTVGKVDDQTSLKELHFAKITYNDVLRMMSEYAALFTVPSLFPEEGDG